MSGSSNTSPKVSQTEAWKDALEALARLGGDFERSLAFTLHIEGGLVDDPDDPGGVTNFGIALRYHPDLTRADIINMTPERAGEIYRREYWTPLGCDAMPWPLCLAVFDAAVIPGPPRARRFYDEAARLGGTPKAMAIRVTEMRREFFRSRNRPKYWKGWNRRCDFVIQKIRES